ncbi:MAG: CBS domain-containing protein [Actinomycetes bacterium]
MKVRDAMRTSVLTIGPQATLRQASHAMADRNVGAVVVLDHDGSGFGILTERDVMASVGAGQDPDRETVGEHLTRDLVFADPSWSLADAALAMTRGGFRHLAVLEDSEVVGIVSVRDVVRYWAEQEMLARLAG